MTRYEMFESFDGDITDRWTLYGVRGEGAVINSPRGRVAWVKAGRREGEEVGKACIVHEFPIPLRAGDRLEVAASFVLPALSGGRISVMDVECKYCGHSFQPGIRLFLDIDRTFYVERGKLGHSGAVRQVRPPHAPLDAWCAVRWRIVLGQADDGAVDLWIDNTKVLSANGATMPDRNVARRHGLSLDAEQLDRIQVGLTANSQPHDTELLMDDIELVVDYAI